MRFSGVFVAAALTLASGVASAQAVLDKPHQILGEGVSRVVAGNYQGAIPKLEAALKLDPTLRDAHYNLGVAYRELGEYDRAIFEYQTALQLTPPADRSGTGQAMYGMALARDARGDHDAWDGYIAWARPQAREQPDVQIARERQAELNGVKIPGTQKAAR